MTDYTDLIVKVRMIASILRPFPNIRLSDCDALDEAAAAIAALTAERDALEKDRLAAIVRAENAEQKLALAKGERDRFLTWLRDTELMREAAEAKVDRLQSLLALWENARFNSESNSTTAALTAKP